MDDTKRLNLKKKKKKNASNENNMLMQCRQLQRSG